MEFYILVGILFLMLVALVVTQKPEGDPESTRAARKKGGGGYVSRRPGQSLSATVSSSQR
jgi:hypothetical protein